jgi:hypothetical protein
LGALLDQGVGVHHYFARALYLLGVSRRLLDDPEWEQPLVDARYVVSLLPEPLPDDLAAIREHLDSA